MNAQCLKKGSTLRHETYRIERVLGQGGFGITYLATDLTLDRLVAIKEFFPKDYCDRAGDTSHITLGTSSASDFVSRLKAKFLKEARNIAKFDHPGIIRIHAAFEENNTAYYVMDYIVGESLSDKVKRFGPLREEVAVRYIKEVAKSLEFVHGKRINHLDIKPANIMIRESDDSPILIDFGLSKQYDTDGNQTSTTPTGISHGYAPLEQYNDGGVKDFSPQTDIYSLAATLYYLITGVTPPHATTLLEKSLAFPNKFPVQLIKPIEKAMSAARTKRHETVKEFICAISEPQEDENTTFDVVQNSPIEHKPQVQHNMPKQGYNQSENELSFKRKLYLAFKGIFYWESKDSFRKDAMLPIAEQRILKKTRNVVNVVFVLGAICVGSFLVFKYLERKDTKQPSAVSLIDFTKSKSVATSDTVPLFNSVDGVIKTPLQFLYNDLVSKGCPLPDSFEKFRDYMISGSNGGYSHRKEVYDALKADGVTLPSTYEQFVKNYFGSYLSTNQIVSIDWDSPLGLASYAGEVDENQLPHGEGVATIRKGQYAGSKYNGHFSHGVYDGQTTYVQKGGDTFVGTFKNNRYYQGCYTIAATGEYFEGTFKNGQPDKGNWYDKNGKKL